MFLSRTRTTCRPSVPPTVAPTRDYYSLDAPFGARTTVCIIYARPSSLLKNGLSWRRFNNTDSKLCWSLNFSYLPSLLRGGASDWAPEGSRLAGYFWASELTALLRIPGEKVPFLQALFIPLTLLFFSGSTPGFQRCCCHLLERNILEILWFDLQRQEVETFPFISARVGAEIFIRSSAGKRSIESILVFLASFCSFEGKKSLLINLLQKKIRYLDF